MYYKIRDILNRIPSWMSDFCGSKIEAKFSFSFILFLDKMLPSYKLRKEHPGKGRNKLLAQRMASTSAIN